MKLPIAASLVVLLASSSAHALWINEFHYDNVSADQNEGVEVAGPAGTNLMGWSLVAYNGNGSESYDSIHVQGIIPDEGAGYGAIWFPFVGLQNGSPDGIALIRPDDSIEEFLTYEGTITAADGPAVGLLSSDVGVSEVSSAVNTSLQRIGFGSQAADFTWNGPVPHSRGLLNDGQSFVAPAPTFVRGDCNADGGYNIADAVRVLDLLFGTMPATCDDACDTNNDGNLDIADAVFLLSNLFSMGASPAAPYPGCGVDTGATSIGCAAFAACP